MVFSAVALGYLVGRFRVRGLELGATGGVLLVSLVFGHVGFAPQPLLGSIGFALFIFAVGLQAGPRFFDVVREGGLRYISLAGVVAITAFGAAWCMGQWLGLEGSLTAGMFAGALTSTPALVGAKSVFEPLQAASALGPAERAALENITIGYALAYVVGTAGLLIAVKVAPRMMRIDLRREAEAYESSHDSKRPHDALPVVRGYEIGGGRLAGKTRRELIAASGGRQVGVRAKRDGQLLELRLDEKLLAGDRVAILAPTERHAELRENPDLIPGVLDPDLLDSSVTSTEVVVARDDAVGKRLSELGAGGEFGCFVTRVRRAQVDLPVVPETVLHRADTLTVAGDSGQVARFAEHVGVIERDVVKTDLVTFGFGISLGLLLGFVRLNVAGVSLALGSPGGILLAGILFGHLRTKYPTFARVPSAARHVIMELGMTFFILNVGLQAGGGVVDSLFSFGPKVFAAAAVVLLVPLVSGFLFGSLVLKLPPILLVGALTGGMTNTVALGAVQQASDSGVPALGYAGTYAFANILMTFAGVLIMSL